MKFVIRTLLLSAVLATSAHAATSAAVVPPTALEISIGGIGPGVDATAFRKVKLAISDAVFRGTIDYFDVYGYGKEGGFQACIEKGRFAATGSFETLIKTLKAIKANPSTTAYSVGVVSAGTRALSTPCTRGLAGFSERKSG
jgi:hypothetical protein